MIAAQDMELLFCELEKFAIYLKAVLETRFRHKSHVSGIVCCKAQLLGELINLAQSFEGFE